MTKAAANSALAAWIVAQQRQAERPHRIAMAHGELLTESDQALLLEFERTPRRPTDGDDPAHRRRAAAASAGPAWAASALMTAVPSSGKGSLSRRSFALR